MVLVKDGVSESGTICDKAGEGEGQNTILRLDNVGILFKSFEKLQECFNEAGGRGSADTSSWTGHSVEQ